MKTLSTTPSGNSQILDAFDMAMDCGDNLAVIGVLLEDSASNPSCDPHETQVLAGAGRLIANEVHKLHAALNILEKQYPLTPSKRHRRSKRKSNPIGKK